MVGAEGGTDGRRHVGGEGEGLGVESEVDGGERRGFGSVERVDQGGERVERGRGRVPETHGSVYAMQWAVAGRSTAYHPTTTSRGLTLRWRSNRARWWSMVDRDLALAVCLVRDTEGVPDLDRVVEIGADSQEGSEDAILRLGRRRWWSRIAARGIGDTWTAGTAPDRVSLSLGRARRPAAESSPWDTGRVDASEVEGRFKVRVIASGLAGQGRGAGVE